MSRRTFLSSVAASAALGITGFRERRARAQVSSEAPRLDLGSRIAIVGAGPAGLYTAWSLQERGYRNISVFERRDRVGGKCYSPQVGGRAHDMAALLLTPDYSRTVELAYSIGLDLVDAGDRNMLDWGTGAVYPLALLAAQMTPEERAAFLAAVQGYYHELALLEPTLGAPGYGIMTEELSQPFLSWLVQKGLTPLLPLFTIVVTTYGYGQLHDVPAAYVLKYINATNFTTMLSGAGAAPPGFPSGWPKRLVGGFQSLMEGLAAEVESAPGTTVRLGVQIESVSRPSVSGRGSSSGQPTSVQYYDRSSERRVSEQFDAVVVACPQTLDNLRFLELSDAERELFAEVRTRHMYTSLCRVDGYEPGVHTGILRNGGFMPPPTGQPTGGYWFYPDSNLATIYLEAEGSIPTEEVEARIYDAFDGIDTPVREIVETQYWNYFPHVGGEALLQGFYQRLEAIQGRHGTYYTGGLMNFEIVENTLAAAEDLVLRHF